MTTWGITSLSRLSVTLVWFKERLSTIRVEWRVLWTNRRSTELIQAFMSICDRRLPFLMLLRWNLWLLARYVELDIIVEASANWELTDNQLWQISSMERSAMLLTSMVTRRCQADLYQGKVLQSRKSITLKYRIRIRLTLKKVKSKRIWSLSARSSLKLFTLVTIASLEKMSLSFLTHKLFRLLTLLRPQFKGQ